MIYDPFDKFDSDISYASNTSNPNINIKGVAGIVNARLDKEARSVAQAESSFLLLRDTKDSLTGLQFDNDQQAEVINSLKKKYDISEAYLDSLTIEDLENPIIVKRIANSYKAMLHDPMWVNTLRTQKQWQGFIDKVPDVYAVNATLGANAMKEYTAYKDGIRNGVSPSILGFSPIDVDKHVKDALSILDRDIRLEIDPESPPGYKFINQITGVEMEREDVQRLAGRLMNNLMDNPQFKHNLEAVIAMNDPESKFDNPEIQKAYLDEMFNDWTADHVVKATVRTDKEDAESTTTGDNDASLENVFGTTEKGLRAINGVKDLQRQYKDLDYGVDRLGISDWANADNRRSTKVKGEDAVLLEWWGEEGGNEAKSVKIPFNRSATKPEKAIPDGTLNYISGGANGICMVISRRLAQVAKMLEDSTTVDIPDPERPNEKVLKYNTAEDLSLIQTINRTARDGGNRNDDLISELDKSGSRDVLKFIDYAKREEERLTENERKGEGLKYKPTPLYHYLLKNPQNLIPVYNFAMQPELQDRYFTEQLLPSYESVDPGSEKLSYEERMYLIHHDGVKGGPDNIRADVYQSGKELFDHYHVNGFTDAGHEEAKRLIRDTAKDSSFGEAQRSMYMIEYLKRVKKVTDLKEIVKYIEANGGTSATTNNLTSTVGQYQVIMSSHIAKLVKLYPNELKGLPIPAPEGVLPVPPGWNEKSTARFRGFGGPGDEVSAGDYDGPVSSTNEDAIGDKEKRDLLLNQARQDSISGSKKSTGSSVFDDITKGNN